MAIAFFPLMSLFTTAMGDIAMTSEMSTSLNLAREGMEIVRNLNLPVERLEQYGSYYYPPLDKEPMEINNNRWRIHTVIHKGTRPLKVEVFVQTEPDKEIKQCLTTLFEDLY